MVSFETAYKRILSNIFIMKTERVSLEDAIGRILDESVKTDRSVPSFDRVMMDGIAINYYTWQKAGRRSFLIRDVQKAGDEQLRLNDKLSAIEVMTGSILPRGTDCVVPYEYFVLKNRTAYLNKNFRIQPFQYVHRKGSNAPKGKVVLKKGMRLTSSRVAVAASVGKKNLDVIQQPRISILATGDELIFPGESIKKHQVYLSNPYAIMSGLKEYEFNFLNSKHCCDTRESLSKHIKQELKISDALIITGGISKGRYDFVQEILKKEGVKEILYGVKQRPGKPLWFGLSQKKQPVFALPGNPISASVCLYQYVIPALFKMRGDSFYESQVVSAEDIIVSSNGLTNFLPVKLDRNGLKNKVRLVKFSNSGDFLSLSLADGFIRVASNKNKIKENERVVFIPLSLR